MIAAQGGDPDAPLPVARETHVVPAPADGVLTSLDALAVGVAAWRLGAGRARKEDPVQAGAGVELHAKPGDRCAAGEPLLTLHTDDAGPLRRARSRRWRAAYDIAPAGSPARPAAAGHRPGQLSGGRYLCTAGLPLRAPPRFGSTQYVVGTGGWPVARVVSGRGRDHVEAQTRRRRRSPAAPLRR